MSKRILTAILLFALCSLPFTVSSAQESITITTYYPSPYGSYNVLRTNYLQMGNLGSESAGQGSPPIYEYIRLSKGSTGSPTASGNYFAGLMYNYNQAGYGDGDDFTIYTYDGRDIYLMAGGANMMLKGSGNVGIGTRSPGHKLDVQGSGITRIRVGSSDNQAGISFVSDNSAENVLYSPSGTDDLRFYLGSADRVSITNAGNVGVGTAGPTAKLQVNKEGNAGQNEWGADHSFTMWGTDQWLGIGVDSTRRVGYLQSIDVGTAASNISLNPLGGNVGVGTAAPTGMLDIRTGSNQNRRMLVFTEDEADFRNFYIDSYYSPIDTAGHQLRFGRRSTESDNGGIENLNILTLAGNGSVGVGTVSPGNNLVLNGINIETKFDVFHNETRNLAHSAAMYVRATSIPGSRSVVRGIVAKTNTDVYGPIDDAAIYGEAENAGTGIGGYSKNSIGVWAMSEGSSPALYSIAYGGAEAISASSTATARFVAKFYGSTTGVWSEKGFISGASSRKVKKDIQGISAADYKEILNKINQVEIVHFRYKDEAPSSKLRMGIIAEDAPDEITISTKDGLDLTAYNAFLLTAIKAQQQEINELKVEIEKLKN